MKLPDELNPPTAWDFCDALSWCPVVNNWCLGIVLFLIGTSNRLSLNRADRSFGDFHVWWGLLYVLLSFHLFVGAAFGCGWIVTMTVLGALGGEIALRSSRNWRRSILDLDDMMLWMVSGALIGCVIGFGFDQLLAWMKSRQVGSISETDTAP